MRIGIDARVLEKGITGVGRYLLNILAELPKYDKVNEYYIFTSVKLKVDASNFKVVCFKESLLHLKLLSPVWLNVTLPKLIKTYNIQLLFSPNVLTPVINIKGVKIVSVVHDIMAKLYGEYYPFMYRRYLDVFLPLSLKKSASIITVSESSKKDIMRIYNVAGEKIHVVYNIAPVEFMPRSNSEYSEDPGFKKLKLPQKYLLYVGMIEKRKNISTIIKLADKLKESGNGINLVLAGRPGYGFEDINCELQKRSGYITYLRGIEDGVLKYIYNSAFAFVFPSYYEGFGSPPLEAMKSGIPVLASNCSSLPEIVGNGGLLFEPDDCEGFYNAVIKMDSDKEFCNNLKMRAVEQAKKFNTEAMITPLLTVFNEGKRDSRSL